MKMLSGKSVLITVFLQLCFSEHVVKAYQFGDLLEFPKLPITDNLSVYKHFAVYVGDETVKGKGEDQNIFEMIRTPTPGGCQFVQKEEPFKVVNHNFDSATNIPQSKADMIKTIEELMSDDKCKNYDLRKGNCEHIATMVRYGKAFCNQKGTLVWPVAAGLEAVKSLGRKKKRREASAAA